MPLTRRARDLFAGFRREKDKDMEPNQIEEINDEEETEETAQPVPQATVIMAVEEGQPHEQAVPEANESEKKSTELETPAEEVASEPEVLTGPDESFNCPPCHGSGLFNGAICSNCLGTGKV